jgi:hypothetical protein
MRASDSMTQLFADAGVHLESERGQFLARAAPLRALLSGLQLLPCVPRQARADLVVPMGVVWNDCELDIVSGGRQ